MFVATSAFWSELPVRWSGTIAIGERPAWRFAVAFAPAVSSTCGSFAAARSTRSTARRTAAASPPLTASTTASWSRSAPWKSDIAWSTDSDPDPGTSKPPLVRLSVWRSVNGNAATSTTTHAASTMRRLRRRKPSSRSIATCMRSSYPDYLSGRPARPGKE